MRTALVLCALLAGQAHAEPMSPDTFDSLSTGRTLYFSDGARSVGAEQYLGNRKVRWMFTDGECSDGFWYEDNSALCFVYEHEPTAQCWLMDETDGTISARRSEFADPTPLFVERMDDQPLACAGPDLGV